MSQQQPVRLISTVITNAGGEGKTWVSMLIKIIFSLTHQELLTLEADYGNQALMVADTNAVRLNPFNKPEHVIERILNDVGPDKTVLIDAGANIFAVSRDFEIILKRLGRSFKDRGYDARAFWVVSGNKLGAAESVNTTATLMTCSPEM